MTASRQALQSILDQLDALQIEADRHAVSIRTDRHVVGMQADGRAATVRAARRLNVGSALLSTSVLMDSAVEHYRGGFTNRAMYTPLLVSALTLAISAHGTTDRRPDIHRVRHGVAVAAAATGLAGTGFHIWNVLKRPGRLDWQNLFYGAPVGAPMAILLAGLLGTAAEWVRDTPGHMPPRLSGIPAGRALAALCGLGLLGTSGEAALLHFRGAFQNKAMFAPVTLPPVSAGLLLNAAVAPKRRERRLARVWLRLTMLMGLAGVGFHAWGIHRAMGGWRNWRQNVVDGPPLPAPPSFTGLALSGLAALDLLRDHQDA
jgi:hypothetical protein